MRQAIGIPIGIDPAPFWANLYLYTYGTDFIYEKRLKIKFVHAIFTRVRGLLMISLPSMMEGNLADLYLKFI